jgi:hypothetical protein
MAAITASSYGTDGLLATTIAYYMPTLEDNIFTSKPLLWAIQQAGRVKNFSGTKIVVPLLYGEAPNVGVYADSDTFGTAANTGISAAEFNFRQFYGLVHFTGIELAKNSGKQALLSLVEARMKQLELTMAENLDEMLFTGTDNDSSDKTWGGLHFALGDSATNTIGAIDKSDSTCAFWRPQYVAAGTGLTLSLMRKRYIACSEGNDHPTNIFTTASIFEDYEDLIDEYARFLDPKMADAGFQNLLFKGTPITYDTYCQSGHMFFLNMKYLTLAKLNNVWFTPSEWLKPTNADIQFKHIRCYGNLVWSNLKRQGCLGTLTEA